MNELVARLGMAWQGSARRGLFTADWQFLRVAFPVATPFGCVRFGLVWRGGVWLGEAWHGAARAVYSGVHLETGVLRWQHLGAWFGRARLGRARQGKARAVYSGLAIFTSRLSADYRKGMGTAKPGMEGLGKAGHGSARQGAGNSSKGSPLLVWPHYFTDQHKEWI